MKLSVSHIAWPPEQEEHALSLLRETGVGTIEVAPLRAFGDPLSATEASVRRRADWYRDRGFEIGSFQALLFGTEGLELFGSGEGSGKMKAMLIALGRIAGWAGAGPMVFGSPKNRLRGNMGHAEAIRKASAFFREVGDECAAAGSCLVIEANPAAYGADFCVTLEEAAELVDATGSAGFGLHVDAGGMALSGEIFQPVLRQAAGLLRHVHASQPNLVSFADPDAIHARISEIFRETGYDRTVAVEMRAQPEGMASVTQAINAVKRIYQIS